MESKEENLQPVDAEEVAWTVLREEAQDEAHRTYPTRLYCGKCDAECDYFGVNPQKILAFVCHHCNEFNEVDSEEPEEDRWIYATNNYATITGNIREGRVWKLSSIARKFDGYELEQFAIAFKPSRMYVFTTRKDW